MATKGSARAWRWTERKPIDTRPIVGIHDDEEQPAWVELLEAFAPYGCGLVAVATLAIAAYATLADYAAGHL